MKSRACFPSLRMTWFAICRLTCLTVANVNLGSRSGEPSSYLLPSLKSRGLWQNANLTADTEASRDRSFGDWNQNGGRFSMPYLKPLWWLVFERGFHAERRSLLTGAAMWGSSSTDPWPFSRERLSEGFFWQ